MAALHTSRGHRPLPRGDVEPTLVRFARDLGCAWGTEGTPHWLVFAPGGELLRSVYGIQENAQTRLAYLLEEQVGGGRA